MLNDVFKFLYVYVNGQRLAILTPSEEEAPAATIEIGEAYYLVNDATGMKLKASSTSQPSPLELVDGSDESDWAVFTQVPSPEAAYTFIQNEQSDFYFRPKANSTGALIEQRPTSYC